jgi:uncharacterized protein (TIGR02266 family)
MADERRGTKRAPISGVRVTFEGATGARIDADVLDLASGGLFIRTDAPLSVGKRIALDLSIVGEPGPWSALGRVVWSRPAAEPGRPAGMGVKLIDVDDSTLEAIERLVDTREPTAPGVGSKPGDALPPVKATPVIVVPPPAAPERERTLMGVGLSTEAAPPLALSPTPPPAVAASEAVTEPIHPRPPPPPPAPPGLEREQSVAIDLVTPKKEASPPPAPVSAPLAPVAPPQSIPPRADPAGSAPWVVIVLLLVVAGIAAYVLFDGFLKPMGR